MFAKAVGWLKSEGGCLYLVSLVGLTFSGRSPHVPAIRTQQG